jgi:hypothetical protein
MDIQESADTIMRQKSIKDKLESLDISKTKFMIILRVGDTIQADIAGTANTLELRGIADLSKEIIIELAKTWRVK